MPELRRLTLQGREWIVFRDVCDVLSIPHPHLTIGMVPLAHRTQSTVVAADGTRSYEWLIDDIGANTLAAQQDRRSTMNQRKRTRRTRGNREVGPVQLELDLDLGPEPTPQPRPRRRVKATRRAATFAEAAGIPPYTPDPEPEEITDVADA